MLSWGANGVTKGLSERVQRPAVDEVVRLSNDPPMKPDEYAVLFTRSDATVGANGFTGTTAGDTHPSRVGMSVTFAHFDRVKRATSVDELSAVVDGTERTC